jgi:hypothetical protein
MAQCSVTYVCLLLYGHSGSVQKQGYFNGSVLQVGIACVRLMLENVGKKKKDKSKNNTGNEVDRIEGGRL